MLASYRVDRPSIWVILMFLHDRIRGCVCDAKTTQAMCALPSASRRVAHIAHGSRVRRAPPMMFLLVFAKWWEGYSTARVSRPPGSGSAALDPWAPWLAGWLACSLSLWPHMGVGCIPHRHSLLADMGSKEKRSLTLFVSMYF